MHLATDNLAAEPTPYFLLRLDLGPDTDARAIRRAYARELKLIDQEADLPAFQTLRECYEVALRWAAYQAQRQQDETAPPDLVPETVPVDPDALALVVYQRFLAAHGKLATGSIMDDVSLWEAELRLRLADDELINLTARATFEARVAHLLAGPWQAANGPLFSAAASVFDWNEDRRRLRQFGYAGAFLNQALEERKLFDAQAVADLAYQRKILARLPRQAAILCKRASDSARRTSLAVARAARPEAGRCDRPRYPLPVPPRRAAGPAHGQV